MKILFAAPDRDLLECYKTILEADFGETVTAFDGTQVISLLSAEDFDILLLDRDIPRIDWKKLILRAEEDRTPVIVLTDEAIGAGQLTQEALPNAFLRYPFTPEQVAFSIRDTLGKASSDERLRCGGAEIDVSAFRIEGGPRVTAGSSPRVTTREIDVIRSLLHDGEVKSDAGSCVSALNEKLAAVGAKARIRYRAKKGFELVIEDE